MDSKKLKTPKKGRPRKAQPVDAPAYSTRGAASGVQTQKVKAREEKQATKEERKTQSALATANQREQLMVRFDMKQVNQAKANRKPAK